MYNIDRKSASRLLKVSVRTVDRYISAQKLSVEQRDGRIWLDKKEINAFKKKRQPLRVSGVDPSGMGEMSIDKTVSTQDDMSIDSVHIVSGSDDEERDESTGRSSRRRSNQDEVYKKLFEDLQLELKTKQERLEGANYRVGQLEALVRESVPLLDHQRLLGEEKAARLDLEEHVETLRDKLEKMLEKLKEEKLSRKVYLVVLVIIMLLQPIWLYLAIRN